MGRNITKASAVLHDLALTRSGHAELGTRFFDQSHKRLVKPADVKGRKPLNANGKMSSCVEIMLFTDQTYIGPTCAGFFW